MKLVLIATLPMLALAAMAAATPARAENVTAANPKSVVSALQDAGYKAELSKTDAGDPMISSAASGTDFIVFFANCHEGKCQTIQYFAGFSDPKNGSASSMNAWNAEHRFTRAYVSDKGSARIEMDVNLDLGGISPALFKDNFDIWLSNLGDFAKYVTAK